MNKLILTVSSLATLALVTPSAHAALIVYEGFDYPQQTGLATQSGGTGWATTWDSISWRTNSSSFGEISTGLTYSTLPTVGQAARNENDFNQSFRTFAPQAASGSYWISFLVQKDNLSANSFGISLFDGGSEKNFMGNANSDKFNVAGEGANISSTTVTTTVSLFVAKYNMTAGLAHFWIDPSLAGEPSAATAFNGAGGTGFTAFGFDRIRLGKFNNGSGYLDEIRIGTTAADVGLVPEPSSLLLLGASGLLAFKRRRHVRALG